MRLDRWVAAPINGIVVLAVAAAAVGCDDPAAPGPPPEAVLLAAEDVVSVQESWSGYTGVVRTVITTPAAWADAWATLHANLTPVPPRPDIDFDSNVVVLAAMGMRATGGYSVTIEEVRAHDGVLHVSVLERSPGPSCVTAQVLTAPVHAVQVPREGTTAVFTVRIASRTC